MVPSARARVLLSCVACLSCAACGRAKGPELSNGCPPEMAAVEGAYCIDRYEASLVEVAPGGERPHSPFESVGATPVRAVVSPGATPQAYVSEQQAARACRASQKRLCSPDEWTRACRGPARATYPYGNEERRGVCNDDGQSPLARVFRGGGAFTSDAMNDPRLNQLPRTVARSGERRGCVSGYGVFDMVGNVHEWVDDPQGTFMGGYYLDTRLNGRGCSYRTTAHDAAYHDYSTGFRCCASIAAAAGHR
jgi:hypothetical protein